MASTDPVPVGGTARRAAAAVRASTLGRETVQDLPVAADRLLRAAAVLRDAGETWHCIYLSGYAVECTLKHVALDLTGLPPTAGVMQSLGQQHLRMRAAYPAAYRRRDYHDLTFWRRLIELYRREAGRPLRGEPYNRLAQQVRTVTRWWRVDMRYVYVPLPHVVANRVYDAAQQIRLQDPRLRS